MSEHALDEGVAGGEEVDPLVGQRFLAVEGAEEARPPGNAGQGSATDIGASECFPHAGALADAGGGVPGRKR